MPRGIRKVLSIDSRTVIASDDEGNAEELDLIVAPNGVLRAVRRPEAPIDQVGDDDRSPTLAEMMLGLDQA